MNKLVICAALILFTSCSKGTNSSITASTGFKMVENACEAFLKADAEEALATSVGDGKTSEQGGKNGERPRVINCTYTASADGSYRSASILIRYASPTEPAAGAAERHRTGYESQVEGVKLEPVDGLSDGAYWDASAGQLTVFKGADMFILSTANLKDPGDLPKLKAVGQRILGRL